MSIALNPINEQAFQRASEALKTQNKAAIFHPTGTGKSCIAWNLVAAHPDTMFFWLVAGAERLALRQAELKRYNQEALPANVRFCDCEKLALATPEQWVKLGEQHPGCIILDCYHELSAVCWAQSVQRLLRLCPQVKLLGLGVPNGTLPCRAAEELFADCIVSHITVPEAMAAGILPVPAAYAAMLWPRDPEMELLRARIKNLCMPKKSNLLRSQYEELNWSMRQVENPTVLLPRLLPDQSGRYLVLFETEDYRDAVRAEVEQLLLATNPAARFYRADHACFADSTAVEAFLTDDSDAPKCLLCVNGPGVQQELAGLSGAILVRQTSQLGVFKQMLCRALAAAGLRSIPIFDLVAHFEGLGNGRTLQRDCTEAMTKAGSTAPGFKQERPMQQTYRVYGRLRRDMEARWDTLYRAAAKAAAAEGTLELPRAYLCDNEPVGKWLEIQRQVQAGQRPGRLTAEQAAKLEKIGIRWNHRLEAAWEKGLIAAQKYRSDHGDLLVPVRYRDRNGFGLGEWIVYNRQRYLSGNLTQSRIERLEALGMVWNTSSDQWEQNYAAAAQYYLEHGDLEVPIRYETSSGFALGIWLGAQRAAYKAGDLNKDQIDRLNALGMDWTNRNDRKWMALYEKATAYYKEHGNLNVPSEYVTPDGVLLGKWIARQRYANLNPTRSSARVTPARKALLDQIGMVWDKHDPWQERYDLAVAYKAKHGDLNVPASYRTEDAVWLGTWVARQRLAMSNGGAELSVERRKLLRTLFKGEGRHATADADRGTVREANWERNFRSASRYAKSHKHLLVPASYIDADGVRLGVWISNLRAAYKNRPDSYQVSPAHIKKLNSIGMVWDARDAKWLAAYQLAADYYAAHGDLHLSANYKNEADGFCLGDWVRRMREWNATNDHKLTPERRALLDRIGMEWED